MNKVKEIQERLKHHNLRKVAEAVGLHENTLYRFMDNRDPRWSTVEKLEAYLKGADNENKSI